MNDDVIKRCIQQGMEQANEQAISRAAKVQVLTISFILSLFSALYSFHANGRKNLPCELYMYSCCFESDLWLWLFGFFHF